MCKQPITLRKYIKLLAEIYFYNIIIGIIFVAVGRDSLSMTTLLRWIWPFRHILQDSFITTFVFFYLTIPFLTILVRNLDRKMHLRLIILFLVAYTLYKTIPTFYVDVGSLSWFCIIFFIASYIRFYDVGKNMSAKTRALYMGLTIVVAYLSVIACLCVGRKIGAEMAYHFVGDLNSIMALLVSVTSFLFFLGIKINYNPIINYLGGASFGVLLIHTNGTTMRDFLWHEMIDNQGSFISGRGWYVAPITIVCIYAICSLIDIIRSLYIEPQYLKALYRNLHIENRIV